MKLEYLFPECGAIVAIIKNFYNESELEKIWREITFLTDEKKLLPPDKTGTATDNNGNALKNNHGIFLDEIYGRHRQISDILTCNRKIYDLNILNSLQKLNPIFGYLKVINNDYTLLSYYQNNNNYSSHMDDSVFTILNYLYKEPKKFKGGNLRLPQFDLTINIENNMLIYLPSCYLHEATKVEMDENDYFSGNGRYCFSNFGNIVLKEIKNG